MVPKSGLTVGLHQDVAYVVMVYHVWPRKIVAGRTVRIYIVVTVPLMELWMVLKLVWTVVNTVRTNAVQVHHVRLQPIVRVRYVPTIYVLRHHALMVFAIIMKPASTVVASHGNITSCIITTSPISYFCVQ